MSIPCYNLLYWSVILLIYDVFYCIQIIIFCKHYINKPSIGSIYWNVEASVQVARKGLHLSQLKCLWYPIWQAVFIKSYVFQITLILLLPSCRLGII